MTPDIITATFAKAASEQIESFFVRLHMTSGAVLRGSVHAPSGGLVRLDQWPEGIRREAATITLVRLDHIIAAEIEE